MRDAHDLVPLAQLLEHASHDFGDPAANSRVHFVEDEHRQLCDLTGHGLDRQAQARQLSAEATFANARGSMPGCTPTRNSTCSKP